MADQQSVRWIDPVVGVEQRQDGARQIGQEGGRPPPVGGSAAAGNTPGGKALGLGVYAWARSRVTSRVAVASQPNPATTTRGISLANPRLSAESHTVPIVHWASRQRISG